MVLTVDEEGGAEGGLARGVGHAACEGSLVVHAHPNQLQANRFNSPNTRGENL